MGQKHNESQNFPSTKVSNSLIKKGDAGKVAGGTKGASYFIVEEQSLISDRYPTLNAA